MGRAGMPLDTTRIGFLEDKKKKIIQRHLLKKIKKTLFKECYCITNKEHCNSVLQQERGWALI